MMKIVRHNEIVLEMKGRREDKEYGAGGLWLVWVVGSVFCALALALSFFHKGTWEMSDAVVAIGAGLFGVAILLFGVFRLFRREHLVLDLVQRQGRYWTWSPWEGPRTQAEFPFEQVDNVTISSKVEVVVAGDDLPGVYHQWEAQLRVRPRLFILLGKSGRKSDVCTLAEKLSKTLGIEILDRPAKSIEGLDADI